MTDRSSNPSSSKESELMAQYGITRVPTEQFLYKSWRYTNLADALAQASRDNLSA